MSAAQAMADAATRALDAIEKGADSVVVASPWVRALAASEGRQGGEFGRVLGLREEPGWGGLGRETFASLFGETERVEASAVPEGSDWMREALSQAESLPEWKGLQARAQGDEWATGVASAAALDVLSQTLPKLPQEDAAQTSDELRYLGDMIRENGASPELLRRRAAAMRRHELAVTEGEATRDALLSNAAVLRSRLRGAANKASQEIEDAEAGLMGLGCGSDSGQRARVSAPRSEVLQALRANAKVAKVAKLAGRLRAQAVRKQEQKASYQRTELADVVTGDDIARLVPSEWALLADEDTEILLYAKLAEKRALQYMLTGTETKAQGPIVLAIDESGSMDGARDEWSKGVALALAEIAARQNRAFHVLHFDTVVSHEQAFENPKAMAFADVLDLVTHFSGGGTRLTAPLGRACELIAAGKAANKALGKADVVLITDGLDSDDLGPSVKALRAIGASSFLFAIGCAASAEHRRLFDSVTEINELDLSGPSTKLDGVFSV